MNEIEQPLILIVDDQLTNLRYLCEILQGKGFRVSVAKNGESALKKASDGIPDLILLDIMMPQMNGYEVCQQLKIQPETCEIPIIFLSALDQSFNQIQGFDLGGADYIVKPFKPEIILARIKYQLELRSAKAKITQLNEDLEVRLQELTQLNQALEEQVIKRDQAEEALKHNALHDALTHLPNRLLFNEHLELAQKRAKRASKRQFAVLFIDLDRFKRINDTMGHQAGDKLLIMVTHRLQQAVRESDVLARLGGDEFVVLLDPITLEQALQVAERILKTFHDPFDLGSGEAYVTASVGIALNDPEEDSVQTLLRNADIAMYRVKEQGKAGVEIFDQDMYVQMVTKHQLEKDLRQAIEKNQFQLHYQPILDLSSERIKGFEALIRWNHPERGWISPIDFIPLAEELGIIVEIGEWVLWQACRQLVSWQAKMPQAIKLFVSVNLSIAQLQQRQFSQTLDQIIQKTGIAYSCLQLELTESMLMDQSQACVNLLHHWADSGIQLSLDDFGTGYSNLSYLHRFPFHSIKVDQSFVRLMLQCREQKKIVETIVNLAHQLGMQAIAEGIETQEHLDYLKLLNCEKGQGYFFSKPIPPSAAEALLITHFSTETHQERSSFKI